MATKKAAKKAPKKAVAKKAPARKKAAKKKAPAKKAGPAIKQKLTKSQIVASLAEATGLDQKEVSSVMDAYDASDRAQHQEAFGG